MKHITQQLPTRALHKKALAALLFISLAAGLFAFPGVSALLPTQSGQYVYYRDYTFPEETYIGFLQYDEGTYAIRYFTPHAVNGELPIIEMYLTLNPDVDYVDITGEKIASPITQKDTEVMNYMHDLMYEFGARRKKLNDVDFHTTVTSNEEFMQFGGDVTITWDFYIPIFNLTSIKDEEGDVLFEAVTCGQLVNNNDQSFVSFIGFDNLPLIDDWYISSITPDTTEPELVYDGNGTYAIGTDGIFQITSYPLFEEELTPQQEAVYAVQLKEQLTQILYSLANSYFSQNLNQYLPYTEIAISESGISFKSVCSENAYDYSKPYYAFTSFVLSGINIDFCYLVIPVEQYWKNAAFYDSLIQ